MTTEREHREAKRLLEREYSNVSELPSHKRLKSVTEMNVKPRIRGLALAKRKMAGRAWTRNLARNALILVTLCFVALAGSVEISCRVNGDPNPNQEWRVGYEITPMIDANDMENCRLNTREHWKARSLDWINSRL